MYPYRVEDAASVYGYTGTLVRYEQTTRLCKALLLGGAVWKVHKEAEDVGYTVDYNHRKEKHLNGTALEALNRPSLLITDALIARAPPPA